VKLFDLVHEADSYQPPELSVGDQILKGKFKNSPAEIKGFTLDKHNQPVLKTNRGEVQLFKPRVAKLMDKGVVEDRPIPKAESGKAIALSNLGKFHAGVDTLGKWVPERLTHQFALDPDKWEHTFYSLTLKEPKKIRYYRPKNVDILPGTLVGDMAIANQFYRTKDPVEQEKYALAYLASLKPYPVNLDDYKFPELLIPRKEQGVAEGVPQPGPSSGAPKQFGSDAKIQTRKMTVGQIISSIPGVPYYNNVVDDWDAKDYHSWNVTEKAIEYAEYFKKHPESLAQLDPIIVLNGKFEDGAHRVSAIWLLQQRMDPKNPLWANAKLNVQFVKQGVAEGKIKLYTDPDYFGAEVDDAGFDSLPVVKISADRLVGFEPDDKMKEPTSRANVKKILAGIKQGDKLPPLLVRKYKDGYQVLDGHHRFWAYKLSGTKSIPVRIVADKDIEEISKPGVAEGTSPKLSAAPIKIGSIYRMKVNGSQTYGKVASINDDRGTVRLRRLNKDGSPYEGAGPDKDSDGRWIQQYHFHVTTPDNLGKRFQMDNMYGELVPYGTAKIPGTEPVGEDKRPEETSPKLSVSKADVVSVQGVVEDREYIPSGKERITRNGIDLVVGIDGATVDIRAMTGDSQMAYVVFDRDGDTLVADDLAVEEQYKGQGIAKIMYDYVKELGFRVNRSSDQLVAGKKFWDKNKGAENNIWEQGVAEGLIDYAQRKLGLKWGKIGDVVNGSVVAEYLDSQDDSMDTDRYINSKFKLINITANEAEKYREISDLNGWPSDTPLEKVKGWGIDDYKMDRIRKNDVTYQSLMKHTPVVSSRGFIINGNHRVARALEMGIDPIPILKELQQGVAEGTEKVNPLTNAVISFYKPVVDQIEPGAVDDYDKQANELLNQAPDPTIRSRMREIFEKGQKDPMIQGGVVTAIAAILTGGLLSSASRMGLSPAQTNILLQAVLNTVIPTIIARINNKSWRDTIKYTLASVGVGMTAAATLSEKRVTEGLSIDVPNEQWLQDKIDYAKSKGRDEWGAPFFGSTTAYVRPNPQVSVVRLELLKGMRNEQNNVRKTDLEWLMAHMEKTSKLPLTNQGEEYAPFVMVAYNGEAWVNEGNHRIMAAYRLGWKKMPVEIKYFDGGERVQDGIMYPGKIGLGQPAAKPVREAYTGPQLKWLKPGELRGSYTDQQLRDRGFNRTGTGKWFILLSRWNELIAKKEIQ
jgi:hypothetical protein